MKRIHARDTTDCKMDLTPLIDCVFLLILFFLLTTEITVQIEDVDLPYALEGKEDETKGDPKAAPVIINVVLTPKEEEPRSGAIRYNGEDVDRKRLTKELSREALHHARAKSEGGLGNGYELGPDGVTKLSKLRVILRADRNVKSQYIRSVFTACAQAAPYKIYQIKVSSMSPE